MIQSNALRVGNYISTIYPNFKYEKVTEIKGNVIYTDNIKGIAYISIKPIQLTEEILLKNSLKIGEKDYLIGDVLFSKFGEDLCYSEGLGYKLSVPIIHVHQLQNIIFALTNQEITINL